jgi:hypothetical protein
MRNLPVMVGAIAISLAYLWFSPTLVPEEYALVSNFVVMPSVLGVLAGVMLVGRLPIKLALLILIPITHVLVFGRDPGKPGLENLLAVVELAVLWIGCVVAHLLVREKAGSAAPQQRPDRH